MTDFLRIVAGILISLHLGLALTAEKSSPKPNIIIIFIDDMGYSDIGPFGSENPTPNLDRMAREGKKFTDFLVSAPVCSSSRASLLTGAYNVRVGISGAYNPHATRGLHSQETTLAELCKSVGYATAVFGKWHLGHHPKFLPPNHGFDEFVGIPYSNDMWPLHPTIATFPDPERSKRKKGFPGLPLIKNDQVINPAISVQDQVDMTVTLTELSIDFIERNQDNPFFLYIPHPMVHVPVFVSEKNEGKSGRGLYGDTVYELDWSLGEIFKTLEKHKLDENTLVIFTSDNGPWLSYGETSGVALPLREGKQTIFAGGVRVPTLMWWPGKIPGGTVTDSLYSTIDILPTVAHLIGADLPALPIDGHDISDHLFSGKQKKSPHETYALYHGPGQLWGIRNERFKLVFPHSYRTLKGRPGGANRRPVLYDSAMAEYALYDLDNDISETMNVVEKFPEVVAELEKAADEYRKILGDGFKDIQGTEVRPEGSLEPGDARLIW